MIEAVIEALGSRVETIEQARDYGVVGCVEPGSNGRSYAHSAAILFNLVSALELTLFNGRHGTRDWIVLISIETGDCGTFASFDQFREAFDKQIRWVADQAVYLNNLFGKFIRTSIPLRFSQASLKVRWKRVWTSSRAAPQSTLPGSRSSDWPTWQTP